jgi:hypothetical protein
MTLMLTQVSILKGCKQTDFELLLSAVIAALIQEAC